VQPGVATDRVALDENELEQVVSALLLLQAVYSDFAEFPALAAVRLRVVLGRVVVGAEVD
jgi:hypothetical protein